MPVDPALYSSESGDWGTPKSFMEVLCHKFGDFDLDVAADWSNYKAPAFYTEAEDGLSEDWWGTVYCNPPYGRNIGDWLHKAYDAQTRVGVDRVHKVVMLVPSRTDTKWWHDFAMKAAEIYLVRGRLRFEGAPSSAPFPSAVLVFNPFHTAPQIFSALDRE